MFPTFPPKCLLVNDIPAAFDFQEPCEDGSHCTTRRRNAHRIDLRELLYPWHPWFGLQVTIYEVVAKGGREVFRCGVSGNPTGRWLEIPVWMFDGAACAQADLSATPRVDIATLSALSAILSVAANGPLNILLSEASRISHDQNRGEIHASPINPLYDLRREQHQIDLYTTISLSGAAAVPEWDALPKEARQALTSLLTRLILEHANKHPALGLKETIYDR